MNHPIQETLFEVKNQKRTIILSLMPGPFKRILNGVKKYEYRRKFIDEAVNAFIYVSSPVKEIKGYIEFGQPIIDKIDKIADIAVKEKEGSREGIFKYMKGLDSGFAVPVLSVRKIQPLSLEELRNHFHFTAPQSYMYIESKPDLGKVLTHRLNETKEKYD